MRDKLTLSPYHIKKKKRAFQEHGQGTWMTLIHPYFHIVVHRSTDCAHLGKGEPNRRMAHTNHAAHKEACDCQHRFPLTCSDVEFYTCRYKYFRVVCRVSWPSVASARVVLLTFAGAVRVYHGCASASIGVPQRSAPGALRSVISCLIIS